MRNSSIERSKKKLFSTSGEIFGHSLLDQKERAIKQLGEKCLYLESYIEKLTRKLLGELSSDESQVSKVDKIVKSVRSEYFM